MTISPDLRPDVAFLLRRPAHFIAMGFGSGLARRAPGTCGTLIGLPMFALLMQIPEPFHLPVIALLFLIGVSVCASTGQALGIPDHGSMVWDEIVAMLLVLEFTPNGWIWWLLAFGLFRLFDIWKPVPIRQFDARLKGGFGVMFDDLLAALYAIAAMKVLQWLTTHYWS